MLIMDMNISKIKQNILRRFVTALIKSMSRVWIMEQQNELKKDNLLKGKL